MGKIPVSWKEAHYFFSGPTEGATAEDSREPGPMGQAAVPEQGAE